VWWAPEQDREPLLRRDDDLILRLDYVGSRRRWRAFLGDENHPYFRAPTEQESVLDVLDGWFDGRIKWNFLPKFTMTAPGKTAGTYVFRRDTEGISFS
jgi:hypothetical protein